MKTLWLMRHAKSSWKHPELDDRERPLNGRGRRDAPEMGRRLAAVGPLPERIVSSPARRARDTALAVAQAAGIDSPGPVVDDRLYFRGADGWLDVLADIDEHVRTLLLVGHNPDFSELVAWLAGLDERNLPTAALARFSVDDDWSKIRPGQAVLTDLDWPRKL
jgi:phosphohistidine phosphatase